MEGTWAPVLSLSGWPWLHLVISLNLRFFISKLRDLEEMLFEVLLVLKVGMSVSLGASSDNMVYLRLCVRL